MLRMYAAPLLLSILVATTLGLATWGFLHGRQATDLLRSQAIDALLIGLLLLAVCAMGAFAIYMLLSAVVL